jgi:hypothetical protein
MHQNVSNKLSAFRKIDESAGREVTASPYFLLRQGRTFPSWIAQFCSPFFWTEAMVSRSESLDIIRASDGALAEPDLF